MWIKKKGQLHYELVLFIRGASNGNWLQAPLDTGRLFLILLC